MFSVNRKIRVRRTREIMDDGFTLIELLIVIVVLGILAAVVIFALGNITGKTAVASCQADGATVSTAMQAFKTENPGVTVTQVLLTNGTDGGPYIQSWPANSPHYFYQITAAGLLQVSVAPPGLVTGGGTYNTYGGPTACAGVQ
jgi:prepilin-type N-terminal cleavage/methylation domain-containing protein